jgi:hypothetical protein
MRQTNQTERSQALWRRCSILLSVSTSTNPAAAFLNSIAAVRAARKTLIDQRRHEVLDEIVKDDWQHGARVIG